MGHKINPTIFRLGTSVDWKYQIKDPLLANITIYKTIKKMFMEYSAPYVSQNIRRKTNPRVGDYQEKKKNVIIKNPFLSRSFFFSHINISYIKNLQLYIFLFDENFEKKRIKKGVFEKSQYYLSGKFFSKDAKHDLYFRKEMVMPLIKKYQYVHKYLKWKTYTMTLKNRKKKRWKKIILKNKQTKKHNIVKKKHVYIKKVIASQTKNYGKNNNKRAFLWILNTLLENKQEKTQALDFCKNLKKICIFIRMLKEYKRKQIKERLFFYAIFLQIVNKILPYINNKIIRKKLTLLQIILNITISTMQYKFFSNNLHIKLKKSRFLTFNLYSKIIMFTLQKTCFINSRKNVEITYLGMANKHISASLLLNMLIVQLGDYINYKQILRNITKRLTRLAHVEGFRIILSGRLTRKERAAYILKNYKSIPLSTYSASIDYASGFKIMKFGCVGIKIYLRLDKISTPPYWYIFKFSNSI